MQVMLMCCIEESRWLALPAAERDAVMKDYGEWVAGLERDGRHRATEKLAGSPAAKTLRLRDGKRIVTDGPFAETREQLGGYFLVDAEDLDEAIEIASKIPGGRYGTVEIRPILEIGGLPEKAAPQPAGAGAHG
jgi:hypothetical protein